MRRHCDRDDHPESPIDGSEPNRPPDRIDSPFIDAANRLDDLLPLAAVPLLTGLLGFDDLVGLAEGSAELSITFGMPTTRVDVWTFLDANAGGTRDVVDVAYPGVGGGMVPPTLVALAVVAYAVVAGLLTAGYFGSIHQGLRTGRFEFAANVRRYGARFVGFELLVLGVFATLAATLFVSTALVPVGLLAAVVAAYLLYPTLYLVVIDDVGLVAALAEAYALTTGPKPTAVFFLAFVGLVAAISVPTSLLARSSLLGGVTVTLATAPIAVVLNAAAMEHVDRIVEPDGAPGADHRSNAPVER